MNIIIFTDATARARTLSSRQLLALVLCWTVLAVLATVWIIAPGSQHGPGNVKHLLPNPFNFSIQHSQKHLDALTLQLGEMQARMSRLDALSDQLAKLAGIKTEDLPTAPGRGGPEVNARSLNANELEQHIAALAEQIAQRGDQLSLLEALLVQKNIKNNLLPDSAPVFASYNSSSFGWRVDPFTGRNAFHEGLDFTADVGSPVFAAADGLVVAAEGRSDYGNIIIVDHGAGMETRYAHLSSFSAKVGDRVQKGQVIGKVGNTGRSTGPHLHFEVRLNGAPLDPRKYLQHDKHA
ncbi:M23 family metallopeptidase [Methylobacillus flagellatus]|uniref:M23 family metallopeptidase n=1 Tax=Methylobacillus flagellatus TaxID=405 RepID=UPI0010F7B3A3|nr:M23 family metallopeptidase [Methylobacillus flagellatus]